MARIKLTVSERVESIIFDTLNHILLIFLCIATLYPFVNVIAVSLNDALDTVRGGIYLWPRKFTFYNYQRIFTSNENLLNAAFISASRAVVGSALSVVSNMILAYTLSRKDFVLRKFFSKMLVYTMYFSGGIIPVYMLMRTLGLLNNFLVYILPGMIGAYNVLVMRSYIDGIPTSFVEAARIDGASEYRILLTVIMPLCLPVMAVVVLFVGVGQWNAWFDTMLYCSTKPQLSTLQYELQKILMAARMMSEQSDLMQQMGSQGVSRTITPAAVRAAMTVIVVFPIMCLYPFLQRYFVSGLTLGGVKG